MNRIILIFLIVFLNQFSFAQYQFDGGARQGGMSGSGVISTDIRSSFRNQAGLADLSGFSAGLFYSNIFNISDLKETSFAISMPMEKYGSAGLNYSYSGNPASNFSKFGLAYAKRLGKRITAGIQIDYLRFAQLHYGNSGTALGEIGFITEPIEDFFVGVHVFNPWRAKLSGTEEYINSTICIGTGYYFSEKVLFTAETEKDIDKPIVFRAGTEYNIIAGLYIRGGVALNPTKYSFGLGYNYKGVTLDAAYISHIILGYYMQFGLGYTLKKTTKEGENE